MSNQVADGRRRATADQLEQELKAIWSEVLEVPDTTVDVDATFLDLGGESISATLCVNRILRKFGVDISAKSLLVDAFTVRKLAMVISQEQLT